MIQKRTGRNRTKPSRTEPNQTKPNRRAQQNHGKKRNTRREWRHTEPNQTERNGTERNQITEPNIIEPNGTKLGQTIRKNNGNNWKKTTRICPKQNETEPKPTKTDHTSTQNRTNTKTENQPDPKQKLTPKPPKITAGEKEKKRLLRVVYPLPPHTNPFFLSPSRRQRDRRTSTGWGFRCPRHRTAAIPIPTAPTQLLTSGRSPKSPKPSVEPGRRVTLPSDWGYHES